MGVLYGKVEKHSEYQQHSDVYTFIFLFLFPLRRWKDLLLIDLIPSAAIEIIQYDFTLVGMRLMM